MTAAVVCISGINTLIHSVAGQFITELINHSVFNRLEFEFYKIAYNRIFPIMCPKAFRFLKYTNIYSRR